MAEQFEFGFGDPTSSNDGLAVWRACREEEFRKLARRIGLPLGHEVEVWLAGSVRLKGKLELDEAPLFAENEDETDLRLRIDRTVFPVGEMESCVRTDA